MSTPEVGSVGAFRCIIAEKTGNAAAMKKIENQYEGEILSTEEEYQMVQANQEHQSSCQQTGAILGGVGGFVAGAAVGTIVGGGTTVALATAGAAAGSVVPGIGTIIGAAVGCAIGIICGLFAGNIVHETSEIDNYTDEAIDNSQEAKEQANIQKQEYLNQMYSEGKEKADETLDEVVKHSNDIDNVNTLSSYDNNIFNISTETEETNSEEDV